jgi:hypothetical protein
MVNNGMDKSKNLRGKRMSKSKYPLVSQPSETRSNKDSRKQVCSKFQTYVGVI